MRKCHYDEIERRMKNEKGKMKEYVKMDSKRYRRIKEYVDSARLCLKNLNMYLDDIEQINKMEKHAKHEKIDKIEYNKENDATFVEKERLNLSNDVFSVCLNNGIVEIQDESDGNNMIVLTKQDAINMFTEVICWINNI